MGASFEALEKDTHGLGAEGTRDTGRVTLGTDEIKIVAYFNVMMCCLSETIVKEGKSYSQADSYFGPVSITKNLWPILTGSNETKEFKLN